LKISLTNRNIPRNKVGDPNFLSLTPISNDETDKQPCILQVFSPPEVVELVNRSLYQLEYQARSHAKYREQRNALEKPVREMFFKLYPGETWAKATNEQLARCLQELKRETK
jgi:hypothetical protein